MTYKPKCMRTNIYPVNQHFVGLPGKQMQRLLGGRTNISTVDKDGGVTGTSSGPIPPY